MHHKQVENANRARFNDMRNASKQNIIKNTHDYQKRNRSTFHDIKEQQKKIASVISQNRNSYLESNKMAYQRGKERSVQAQNRFTSKHDLYMRSTQEGYFSRVQDKISAADAISMANKKLEQEESLML